MFEHPKEELFTLTRNDPNDPLSSYSKHAFELDGAEWPSVEHYYQAMKFESPEYREQIRQAGHPKDAARLGHKWFQKRRKDWKKHSVTMMTRGVYIKCRTYPEVAQVLLDTGDLRIAELSGYDYFWGSGRDMRGKNHFGKVLMAVRDRLREEQRAQEKADG